MMMVLMMVMVIKKKKNLTFRILGFSRQSQEALPIYLS